MNKKLVVGTRVFSLVLILIMGAGIVSAGNFVNGDFESGDETGWTRWNSGWGGGFSWAVVSDPGWGSFVGDLQTTTGSFGWFQRVAVSGPGAYTVDAMWAGDIGGSGWAEIMFFPANSADSDAVIINRIDVGNAADIAYKKDSWGMNPPTAWTPEAASLSLQPGGNGGVAVVTTEDQLVVGVKLGSAGGGGWLQVDEVLPLDPTAVSVGQLGANNLSSLALPAAALLVGLVGSTFIVSQRRRRIG